MSRVEWRATNFAAGVIRGGVMKRLVDSGTDIYLKPRMVYNAFGFAGVASERGPCGMIVRGINRSM